VTPTDPACDFRIASERASFADTHARVGVAPNWGLTARLSAAVGQGCVGLADSTLVHAPAAGVHPLPEEFRSALETVRLT
jgi:hypothetical protein